MALAIHEIRHHEAISGITPPNPALDGLARKNHQAIGHFSFTSALI
jgi:hypothetical protein